jgi:AraC-like DNA-binding protein
MDDFLLEFTRKILLDVKIKSYLVTEPYVWSNEYDNGLRISILKTTSNTNDEHIGISHFQETMSAINQDHIIYSIRDDFNCEYLCFKIPSEQPTNLLIGPFTYEVLTIERITELCEFSHVPHHLIDFMLQHLSSIPYVSDEKWLKSMIRSLAAHFYNSTDDIKMIRHHLNTTDHSERAFNDEIPEPDDNTISILEQRYQHENQIISCISVGDYKTIEQLIQDGLFPNPKQRFPDTLRDTKNKLIIYNTLCRKAAENGDVHPIYLDDISRKYATLIENCNSVIKLNQFPKEMTRKYCMLVQQHSLKNYSLPIRTVMNQISFHLDSDLSLEALADLAGLNKSYLSSLFKKETGETLTNYVNTKRIDHSIYLLNTTKLNIHEISALCGIDDLNYFTKLFKRNKNMTPSEYRNMIHKSK